MGPSELPLEEFTNTVKNPFKETVTANTAYTAVAGGDGAGTVLDLGIHGLPVPILMRPHRSRIRSRQQSRRPAIPLMRNAPHAQ